MTKEQLITPVIVIGLSLAFIVVSFLVYLFNANPRLIRSKLKIGAAILTLTAFVNTHSFSQKTCYKPAIRKEIVSMDNISANSVLTIYDNDKVLTGKMSNILSMEYYYVISDTAGKKILKGIVKASDGKFDCDTESFGIHFGKIAAGVYSLTITSSARKNDSSAYIYRCKLIVLNESEKMKVPCYYY